MNNCSVYGVRIQTCVRYLFTPLCSRAIFGQTEVVDEQPSMEVSGEEDKPINVDVVHAAVVPPTHQVDSDGGQRAHEHSRARA